MSDTPEELWRQIIDVAEADGKLPEFALRMCMNHEALREAYSVIVDVKPIEGYTQSGRDEKCVFCSAYTYAGVPLEHKDDCLQAVAANWLATH